MLISKSIGYRPKCCKTLSRYQPALCSRTVTARSSPPAILHCLMVHKAKTVFSTHSPAWGNASVLHLGTASTLLVRSSVRETFSRESRHIQTSHQYQMHWIPQMQEPQYLFEALGPRFQWGTNSQMLPKEHSYCQKSRGHLACSVLGDSWTPDSVPIKPVTLVPLRAFQGIAQVSLA